MGDLSELKEREDKLQGMGTSLLRKEDAEFIRGQGSTSTTSSCPACCSARSCAARTRTRASRASTRAKALACPGVVAVLTADDLKPVKLHWMPTARRRRAGGAGRPEGALPDAGGGDGAGHRPLRRLRRRRAGRGGLRRTAGDRRPEEGDGPGRGDHPRRHRRQEGSRPRPAHAPEPHLHVGGRRQGGGRRRVQGRRGHGARRDPEPARAPLPARNLRLRGVVQQGHRLPHACT